MLFFITLIFVIRSWPQQKFDLEENDDYMYFGSNMEKMENSEEEENYQSNYFEENENNLEEEENDFYSEEEENYQSNYFEENDLYENYEEAENHLEEEENGKKWKKWKRTVSKPFKKAGKAGGKALKKAGKAGEKALKKAGKAGEKALKKAGKAGGKAIKKVSKAATKSVEKYAKTTKKAMKATGKFIKKYKSLISSAVLTIASVYCPALAPVLQMKQYYNAAKAAKGLYDSRKEIGRNLKKGRLDKAGKIIASKGGPLVSNYANKFSSQISDWAVKNLPQVSKGIEAYKEGKQYVDKYVKMAQDVKQKVNKYKDAYDQIINMKSSIKTELRDSIDYELSKHNLSPKQLFGSKKAAKSFIKDVKLHLSEETLKSLGDADLVKIAAELSKNVSSSLKESKSFVKKFSHKVSSSFKSQIEDFKKVNDVSNETLTKIESKIEDIRKQYGASVLGVQKSIEEQMKESMERVADHYRKLYENAYLSLQNKFEKAEASLTSYQLEIESKIIKQANKNMISSIVQEIGQEDYDRYNNFFEELSKGNYDVEIPSGLDTDGKLSKMILELKQKHENEIQPIKKEKIKVSHKEKAVDDYIQSRLKLIEKEIDSIKVLFPKYSKKISMHYKNELSSLFE